MTALPAAAAPAPLAPRIWNVVRMQLVNRQTFVWIPLIILSSALAISLLIWAMLPGNGVKWSGGSQGPLWYFFAIGIQSLTFTFPFSQAMSVTRREFFLGTLLTAGLTAALLTVTFVVGGGIELATNGWGLNGYFFYLDWVWEAGPLGAALVYFVVAMLFFITGFWAATIYKRFGTLRLVVTLVGIGLALVGLLWLVGRLDAWAQVGAWLAGQGAVGLAGWGVVLAVALAGISYLTLRRAIP